MKKETGLQKKVRKEKNWKIGNGVNVVLQAQKKGSKGDLNNVGSENTA